MAEKNGSTPSRAPASKRGPEVKVYLILVPVPFARPGKPNVKIAAAKLSREKADEAALEIPNAYVEKVIADKSDPDLDLIMKRL
jgi:hypothetical protein